ncbi:MAG: hypothetical protein Q4C95_10265 [Planctomycetia bacterium]|nr:hypothetical protein [Planctomycetia bacterium]
MTEPWDNKHLELTPEVEEDFDIAPEESFSEGMILVPVICGTCKLRMYASEKHIGKWLICPDCERKSLIRSVQAEAKFKVELSKEGVLTLIKQEPPLRPVFKPDLDYRTVKGSIDEDAEKIPFINLSEEADDPLESFIDRLLIKKKPSQNNETATALGQNIPETPEEKKQRLIQELIRQKELSARTTKDLQHEILDNSVSKQEMSLKTQSSTDPKPSLEKKEDIETPKTLDSSSIPTESSVSAFSKKRRVTFGNPWKLRHFFFPLFDKDNQVRFFFCWIFGTIAILMSFNFFRFFGQFLFSADPRGSSYVYQTSDIFLFYIEYLAAFCPLAVWILCMIINGMTFFSKTKDGFHRMGKWILFRTEFAASYLFWFFLVLSISPFPGVLLSLVLKWNGADSFWRLGLPFISIHLFFPLLFLSIIFHDNGLELFHRKVWKSLIVHPYAWIAYYLFSIPIIASFILALMVGNYLIIYFIDKDFWLAQISFCVATLILCPLFSWDIYLYFRLLGALAWSVDQ